MVCASFAVERPTVLTLLPPEIFVARPALWLRAISRYRGTVSAAPNFAYGLCTRKISDEELEGVDLSSWRVALNGAETVSPQVMRAFRRRFAAWGLRREALSPVYGLAEAALAVTFPVLEEPFRALRFERASLTPGEEPRLAEDGFELASLGRPLPGFSISVRDRLGAAQDPARVGRIWVRGPSLMAGYLDRDGATADVVRDGWLDTGDLGFLRQDELYVVGRAKDMLIVRGRNIAPETAEWALDEVVGVRRGCTVAVGQAVPGGETERVLLFVERERGAGREDSTELEGRCVRAVLAAIGVQADKVIILPPGALPRTSSGKIRRREALRRFEVGELTPPGRVNAVTLARALARSALAHRRARMGE